MDVNNFNKITVIDLTAICRSHMKLSRLDCQTRASIYTAIQKQHIVVQEAIDVGVETAVQGGFVKHGKVRKRREAEDGHGGCKRQRLYKEEGRSIEEKGGFFCLGIFLGDYIVLMLFSRMYRRTNGFGCFGVDESSSCWILA
jgi:hypothetical protein